MVKQAIIYGGAFNPPTVAHTLILSACAQQARRTGAEIWLLPSGTRADKTITVSRHTRLQYLDALIGDTQLHGATVRILTLELDRARPTETFDMVMELRALYPEYRQTWVFGADSAATMRRWHHGEWLTRHLRMIIVPRIGTDESTAASVAHGTVMRVTTPAVSSTQVRELLAAGKSVDALVGPRVRDLLVRG